MTTQIGNVYGQALYSLAVSENLSKDILDQLQVLSAGFNQEPKYIRLLSAPNISKAERCQIIDDSFRDVVHPYVLNFLKILTEKGYVRQFAQCVKAYCQQYNEDNGIIPVRAVTAFALNEEHLAKLKAKLEQITGKRVELENQVEPDCLGGVRLDYEGMRLDGTIQARLDSIRNLLKNTVL